MPSIIQSTRRGFLYQDRVALLTFLIHYSRNDIHAFYVDYPIPQSKKSLDIRLIDANDTEKVTEVKSGEVFKRDTATDHKTQIADAISDLDKYISSNPNCEGRLVVSPKAKAKVAGYWASLTEIKEANSYTPYIRKVSLDLAKKLGIPGKKTAKSVYEIAHKIQIEEGKNDCLNGESDRFCDLDDDICNIIDDFASKFHAKATDNELPSSLLMYELMQICALNAGTGTDIFPLLKDKIISFLGHRKLLDKNLARIVDRDGEQQHHYEDMTRQFTQWETSVPVPTTAVLTIPEGGSI